MAVVYLPYLSAMMKPITDSRMRLEAEASAGLIASTFAVRSKTDWSALQRPGGGTFFSRFSKLVS